MRLASSLSWLADLCLGTFWLSDYRSTDMAVPVWALGIDLDVGRFIYLAMFCSLYSMDPRIHTANTGPGIQGCISPQLRWPLIKHQIYYVIVA